MAELDKSKQAHVSVFMFLRSNGQSIRPFVSEDGTPGMGLEKMLDLTYFNSASSQDMLKAAAAQMAHMLIVYINKYYTQEREPNYANKTIPELVATLTTVFVDPDKMVSKLADAVDEIFRYQNERSAAVPVAMMARDQPLSADLKKRLKKIGIN